ncbi:hypothetical protein C3F09_01855 [candidate division GN15 bacterium]|uniref:M28 family peptidase n=1 Tax=candidate division GN15 bacterium TaxID=2072418 RepID=A0A855X5V5_9BACT|nr:MAG: hypothetical protein C3F09_01855 [candidate division GN15 bacterium]
MRALWLTALVCLIASLACQAGQPYNFQPQALVQHIAVLASDSLEGREIGTIGEWKAARYIIGVFKEAGLRPAGSDGYLQPFEFIRKIDFGPDNRLAIDKKSLELGVDYVPLEQSASTQFSFTEIVPVGYGIRTEDSAYDDYAGKDVTGKAVLIKRFSPSAEQYPKVDFTRYNSWADKIRNAVDHKAAGIFFVTPPNEDDTLKPYGPMRVAPRDIPIIFVKRRALDRLGISVDSPSFASASGQTELIQVKDTGYNILGELPGASDTTIILGAHYDHLGWGAPGSRDTSSKPRIHPGADDNASGTAALLEMARYYASNPHRHSLLFAAFSGEEEGVLGSTYYVRHWTIDSSKVRMMLNMDMIGRLKDQQNGLAIFGVGTAAEFKPYFDSLKVDSIRLSFLEPGTGPSDQIAFYHSGIPVLHFFTGAHEDYHTASDTPDKIDYPGIVRVETLVSDVVNHFDSLGTPLTFQRTASSDQPKTRAEYKVTLGIMPDYTTPAKGLAVGGVSPNKSAEKAGIKKGDIVIKLGAIEIEDIYSYMSALSKFNKGDTTTVVIVRATDTLSFPVTF